MPRNLSTSSPTFPPPPSARHYHSDLSIWLSVDPMADKYPGVSPYVYCANNPVRLVDPNGRDWWTFDKQGKIKKLKTISDSDCDYLIKPGKVKIDRNGNPIEYGMFGQHRAVKVTKGVLKEAIDNENYLLESHDKSEARGVFNLLADNTNVEWGFMQYQDNGTDNNYYIGTSYENENEGCVSYLIYDIDGGNVTIYHHSHPVRASREGDQLNLYKYSQDDVELWNDAVKKHPNITLGMRWGGKTKIYYRNGQPTPDYYEPSNRAYE